MDEIVGCVNIGMASKMLGVSCGTLRNWDKSGKFVANRDPSNKYRIYRLDKIESFLKDINDQRNDVE